MEDDRRLIGVEFTVSAKILSSHSPKANPLVRDGQPYTGKNKDTGSNACATPRTEL